MDPLDKPEHIAAVDALVAKLDLPELTARVNVANGGGTLDQANVRNLVKLVCLGALRYRGRSLLVAGIGAQWSEGKLVVFIGSQVAEAEVELAEPESP